MQMFVFFHIYFKSQFELVCQAVLASHIDNSFLSLQTSFQETINYTYLFEIPPLRLQPFCAVLRPIWGAHLQSISSSVFILSFIWKVITGFPLALLTALVNGMNGDSGCPMSASLSGRLPVTSISSLSFKAR